MSANDRELGPIQSALKEAVYEASLDCVHCGLCLQACPTYLVTGRETASPRGRIYLMRGLAEGRLEDPALLETEAFACLGCRACETACPSGVFISPVSSSASRFARSCRIRFDCDSSSVCSASSSGFDSIDWRRSCYPDVSAT